MILLQIVPTLSLRSSNEMNIDEEINKSIEEGVSKLKELLNKNLSPSELHEENVKTFREYEVKLAELRKRKQEADHPFFKKL